MAPAESRSRPLRLWEQLCLTMNVTMSFQLDGSLTEHLVKRAWAACMEEFPYLRCGIKFKAVGQGQDQPFGTGPSEPSALPQLVFEELSNPVRNCSS